MENRKYQICTVTVMDTTDPDITFNEKGESNYVAYFNELSKNWHPNEEGERKLEQWADKLKKKNKNKRYDCILGLSGGLDSSYLAYKMKDYGLRILALHVDAGWNSEIAVGNIEKLVNYCNYDLITKVINWETVRNLQVAYLKSGLANQDVPQDHIFFATLWKVSSEYNITTVLSGGNISTESILPKSWGYDAMDAKQLKFINKKFGTGSLKGYNTISIPKYHFYYRLLRGVQVVKPLNMLPYIVKDARVELEREAGWASYGDKHHESVFTKFFQGYYLPEKFGYDKRRAHLSSMILSGQITRDEALEELKKPPYDLSQIDRDITYISEKLGLDKSEFTRIVEGPKHHWTDFPNDAEAKNKIVKLKTLLKGIIS